MSNEIINQQPTVERAKELEQQVKEGLLQLQAGQDKAMQACHKMRDTKAYKALGFTSYYAWGESTLNLQKSRLNELALAGEVQRELLTGIAVNEQSLDTDESFDNAEPLESMNATRDDVEIDFEEPETNTESLTATPVKYAFTSAELAEMNTPQLVALAKAPKGERLAVLDTAAIEAKAEDTPITTHIIKAAVKASAEPIEYIEPSAEEKAATIKKDHKSAMKKVSKLNETLKDLDTTDVNSEEIANWQSYLDEIKESISVLEKQLGY
jgi:hypothetical protein